MTKSKKQMTLEQADQLEAFKNLLVDERAAVKECKVEIRETAAHLRDLKAALKEATREFTETSKRVKKLTKKYKGWAKP